MRNDEGNVDAARQQNLQAAYTDVVIGEDDGTQLISRRN